MVNATVWAHAFANWKVMTYSAGFLARCSCFFCVGQSLFHTTNLEPLRTTGSMSTGMFFLGLVTLVVVSWVAAFATAELYRRWAE